MRCQFLIMDLEYEILHFFPAATGYYYLRTKDPSQAFDLDAAEWRQMPTEAEKQESLDRLLSRFDIVYKEAVATLANIPEST